ncbi:MAG: tRNA (adenosine(37)-N6)-dimethylallyltransferase MiaA [Thioalkalispiraceae bacterium]|jgi:tRNA dimethylallyltransferase
MSDKPPIVCILGPTASGKTDLAVELVERYPMDIISVDSAMVYQDMDIGTAKPDPETLARAPHRLIDFLDPAVAYSAAEFRRDALREMESSTAQGRIPLLVGGTMMYFKSLLHGLAEMPAADEQTREALLVEAREKGWDKMHIKLAKVDPESAQRIHPNDPQRISRALEVYQLTGVPLSAWQAEPTEPLPYSPLLIALFPSDRAWLHERIERRFHLMVKQGLVDEVQALFQRGDLDESMPSIRAVGYRQVWQYLQGEYDENQMIERGIIATRQLAKRQLTWLRSMPDLITLDCVNNDLRKEVLKLLSTSPITN